MRCLHHDFTQIWVWNVSQHFRSKLWLWLYSALSMKFHHVYTKFGCLRHYCTKFWVYDVSVITVLSFECTMSPSLLYWVLSVRCLCVQSNWDLNLHWYCTMFHCYCCSIFLSMFVLCWPLCEFSPLACPNQNSTSFSTRVVPAGSYYQPCCWRPSNVCGGEGGGEEG